MWIPARVAGHDALVSKGPQYVPRGPVEREPRSTSLNCPSGPVSGAFFLYALDTRLVRTGLFYFGSRQRRKARPGSPAAGRAKDKGSGTGRAPVIKMSSTFAP